MRIGKFRAAGFSLVEMIAVLVITASLGAVLYTTFAQGVRLWGRSAKDRGEWKVALFVEKMTGEIRNAFRDPQWVFQGNKNELNFATLSFEGKRGERQGSRLLPLYLHYLFDPASKTVSVQRYNFEDVFSPKPVPKPYSVVLDKVRTFELEYYAYDPKAKKYYWTSMWNKDCFPETIKITIEHEQTDSRKLARMIDVPVEAVCQV